MDLTRYVFVDTEGTGLDPHDARVLTTGIGWYAPGAGGPRFLHDPSGRFDPRGGSRLPWCGPWPPGRIPVFFNAKHDIAALRKVGIAGLEDRPFHDVLLMSVLTRPLMRKRSLEALVRKELGKGLPRAEALDAWLAAQNRQRARAGLQPLVAGDAPLELLEPYCLEDVANTARLFALYAPAIVKKPAFRKPYKAALDVLAPVLAMERRGFCVDADLLTAAEEQADAAIVRAERRCHELAGVEFRVTAAADCAQVVLKDLPPGFVLRYTPGGKPSLDEAQLRELGTPLALALLRARELKKVRGTYLKGLRRHLQSSAPVTVLRDLPPGFVGCHIDAPAHRVHASFNVAQAITGRFSCSSPRGKKAGWLNLQNVPRAGSRKPAAVMRQLFRAPHGLQLVGCDYKGIELRVAAWMAQDERMLAAFAEGRNVHQETATGMFGRDPSDPLWDGWYNSGKRFNFLALYGGGAGQLLRVLQQEQPTFACTLQDCRGFLAAFWRHWPQLHELHVKAAEEVQRTGGIGSPLGRWYPVPRDEPHKAVNYAVQGTCAYVLMGAMTRWHRARLEDPWLDQRAALVACIHDELLFEVLPDARMAEVVIRILELMEDVPAPLPLLPADAKVCFPTWADARKLELVRA